MARTNGTSLSGTSLSARLVEEVARKEGVRPENLSPRLYDVVEPDALEKLYDSATGSGLRVTFDYGDWRVAIDEHGEFDLTPIDDRLATQLD